MEMIARSAKRIIAHRLATKPPGGGTTPEEHIISWVNALLGLSEEEQWGDEPRQPGSCLEALDQQIERSFQFRFPAEAAASLFPHARIQLALALQRTAGITINEKDLRGLSSSSCEALLSSSISVGFHAKSLEGELYREEWHKLTEGEALALASLYGTSGDQGTAGQVYNHLAERSLALGQIEAAMSHSSNALRSGPAIGVGAIEANISLMKAETALAEDEMCPCSSGSPSEVHLSGAMAMARLVFGSNHPIFIDIEQGLGLKYAQRGEWEVASEHFAACVEMAQITCGEGHCLTAECLLLLGKSCEAAGDVHKSLRSYERATAIMWKLQERSGGQSEAGRGLPKHVQDKMATCYESYAALLGKHSDKSDWHAAYMWAGRAAAVNRRNTCLESSILHRSLHVCAELAALVEDTEASAAHYEEILTSLKEEGEASRADEIQRITRKILGLKMESLPAEQRLALDSKLARVQGNITVGYDHQQMSKVFQSLSEESPSAYMEALRQRRMSKNYELEIVAMLVHAHEGA
jgi:tetratricopeptide (TPR) repeat protein